MVDKVCFEDELFKALIVEIGFVVLFLVLLIRPVVFFLIMVTIGNCECRTPWLKHIEFEGEVAHVKLKLISIFLSLSLSLLLSYLGIFGS